MPNDLAEDPVEPSAMRPKAGGDGQQLARRVTSSPAAGERYRMRYRRLQDIVTAFPDKRVLVIGDVMLDEYIWGEVRRISPEAPVPVVEARRRTYMPGGAGNTAANVVSLSGQALLGGVVGRDHQATRLSEALQQSGIESRGIIVDEN